MAPMKNSTSQIAASKSLPPFLPSFSSPSTSFRIRITSTLGPGRQLMIWVEALQIHSCTKTLGPSVVSFLEQKLTLDLTHLFFSNTYIWTNSLHWDIHTHTNILLTVKENETFFLLSFFLLLPLFTFIPSLLSLLLSAPLFPKILSTFRTDSDSDFIRLNFSYLSYINISMNTWHYLNLICHLCRWCE